MSNGLKLLLMAASAIIVCIVCAVGFNLTKDGRSNVNNAGGKYTSMTSEYDNVELLSYDGMTISGGQLADLVKKVLITNADSTVSIKVITKLNASGLEYTTSNAAAKIATNTADSSSKENDYINPVGQFTGAVTRNNNGVIEKVTFTQK